MDSDQRYIDNIFPDYNSETFSTDIKKLRAEIVPTFVQKLKLFVKQLPVLSKKVPTTYSKPKQDPYIYVGLGGHAYAYWRLSIYFKNQERIELSEKYLREGLSILAQCQKLIASQKSRCLTFYLSQAGIYTLSYILNRQLSSERITIANKYLQQLNSLMPRVISDKNQCQVLYGLSGYLYCYLLIQKYYPDAYVDVKVILAQLYRIGSGDYTQKLLYYVFHKTPYLGAAHGVIGIMYLIIEAIWLNPTIVSEMHDSFQKVLTSTCQKMLQFQADDGNICTKLGQKKAKIVHWCHGAPGYLMLLCSCYKLLGEDKKYLDAALKAGQCVWEKGIIKKGNSLCHGIAGNAYSLMTLYNCTKDEKWKFRAFTFAKAMQNEKILSICGKYDDKQRAVVGKSDHPFSLMEGLAQVYEIFVMINCINLGGNCVCMQIFQTSNKVKLSSLGFKYDQYLKFLIEYKQI